VRSHELTGPIESLNMRHLNHYTACLPLAPGAAMREDSSYLMFLSRSCVFLDEPSCFAQEFSQRRLRLLFDSITIVAM